MSYNRINKSRLRSLPIISFSISPPPINLQLLKEIDLNEILKNPQLRHDILFDPNLQFRPNLDGERGKRKKCVIDRYWKEIKEEIKSITRCNNNQTTVKIKGDSNNKASKPLPKISKSRLIRLPILFQTLKDVLLSLLPTKDRLLVLDIIDVDLIIQQISLASFDFVQFAQFLGKLFSLHCAPLRDGWIGEMVGKFEDAADLFEAQKNEQNESATKNGNSNNDSTTKSIESLVSGLRQIFQILEAMKLDVANHQIRMLRPLLVSSAIDFEKEYFNLLLAANKIDIADALKWFAQNYEKSAGVTLGLTTIIPEPKKYFTEQALSPVEADKALDRSNNDTPITELRSNKRENINDSDRLKKRINLGPMIDCGRFDNPVKLDVSLNLAMNTDSHFSNTESQFQNTDDFSKFNNAVKSNITFKSIDFGKGGSTIQSSAFNQSNIPASNISFKSIEFAKSDVSSGSCKSMNFANSPSTKHPTPILPLLNLPSSSSSINVSQQSLKSCLLTSIIDLLSCRKMTSEFPSTLIFDHTRLILLRADVRQLVCMQLCLILYRNLLVTFKKDMTLANKENLDKTQQEILAIVTDSNGNIKWTKNIHLIVLQLVKKANGGDFTNLPTEMIEFGQNWLVKHIQPSSKVYELMEIKIFKNLKSEIDENLEKHQIKIERGNFDLKSIAGRIEVLARFHFQVFGGFYENHIRKMTSPE